MGHEQTRVKSPRRGAEARSSTTRVGSGRIGAEARPPGSVCRYASRGRSGGGAPCAGDPPGAGLGHLTSACRRRATVGIRGWRALLGCGPRLTRGVRCPKCGGKIEMRKVEREHLKTTVPTLFLRLGEVLSDMSDRGFRHICSRTANISTLFTDLSLTLETAVHDLEKGPLTAVQREKLKTLCANFHDALQRGSTLMMSFGELPELIDLLRRCAYAKAIDLLEQSNENLHVPIHAHYFSDDFRGLAALLTAEDTSPRIPIQKLRSAVDLFRKLSNRAKRL